MAKPWKLGADAPSLNDSAFRNLLLGSHGYEITGFKFVAVKSDATGQTQQIQVNLRGHEDDNTYTVFLGVMAANDQQREIAEKTVIAFRDACNLSGELTAVRFPQFVGKHVTINAREGKAGTDGVKRVNISTVDPYEETSGGDTGSNETGEGANPDEAGAADAPAEKAAAPAAEKPKPTCGKPPWAKK